jgi:hypothetical protein
MIRRSELERTNTRNFQESQGLCYSRLGQYVSIRGLSPISVETPIESNEAIMSRRCRARPIDLNNARLRMYLLHPALYNQKDPR